MKSAYGALRRSIERKLKGKAADWAFTPGDLADLGDPRSVGKELSRMVVAGKIRRVRRGIYEIPRPHPMIGTAGAGTEAVVAAIARRDGLKLLPSGAHAANLLGLSPQVSARETYGVQGRSRNSDEIGRDLVQFRRRSTKTMMMAGRASGWVAEALRSIGRVHLSPERLQTLRARLGAKEKKQLRADLRYAPAWMRPFFLELSRDD
ncbi:MAG: hypothetical protein B9S34_03790 [Opitutia bacterium Tous-C1TDCM]|nr:MAG: hypothetical protein B9S34_03790 [Opitutae bacterium Tous-C1TDCM]